MTKRDIQQMLQECLEGYDAGMSPEECLSAYPQARRELEPLFRQALSLRVAFAAAPRPEFKVEAREKLLFAAGRDVVRALSSDPDPDFVQTTRQRLLNRAGASAQEALRDVPPPRLPFWMNARRHLLETAATTPPKPARHAIVGMRSAVSAAVVAFAVAIAGAGFLLQDSSTDGPTSASAELDAITKDLAILEQRKAQGQIIPPGAYDDLAARTNQLAEQIAAPSPDDEGVIEKLPDLIDRQQDLLEEEDSLNESMAAAQERLDEAARLAAAAVVESPEPTSTPEEAAAVTSPTPSPTIEPSPEPSATTAATATGTPEVTVPAVDILTPADLTEDQLVKQYDASIEAFDMRWWRVTTRTLTFVMPEMWTLGNTTVDENGLAVLVSDYVFVNTDLEGIILVVNTKTGEVITSEYELRSEEPDGSVIGADQLIELAGSEENALVLYQMLTSLEVSSTPNDMPTPTQTTTPTGTATPTETVGPDETPTETP